MGKKKKQKKIKKKIKNFASATGEKGEGVGGGGGGYCEENGVSGVTLFYHCKKHFKLFGWPSLLIHKPTACRRSD